MLGRVSVVFLLGVAVLPAQNPKARAAYEAGVAHQTTGAHADAVTDFTAAISLWPDYAAALRARALSYSVLGQEKVALADLDRALVMKVDDLGAWTLRGQLHMRRGELEAAANDFSHVLKQSSDPALRLRRGTAYRGLGRYAEARADLDLAISADPANPEAYYQRGLVAAAEEHWVEAESDFNRSIERNPDYIPAFLERGAARVNARSYGPAIADLSRYIAHAPRHGRALVTRAEAYAKQGNPAAARADLQRALEADANDKVAAEALANLDAAAAPTPPTVTAAPPTQEVTAAPGARPVVINTVSAPVQAPVLEAAKVIAQPADITPAPSKDIPPTAPAKAAPPAPPVKVIAPKVAAPPPPPPVATAAANTALQHNGRGREFNSREQFGEAVAEFSQAIQLDPKMSQAYNSRGYALLRLLRLREAVNDFNRAIEVNPAYKNAFHNRAAARRALGDNTGADADAAKEASLP